MPASVSVRLVLVVPLVAWQLVAGLTRQRRLRHVVECGSNHVDELRHVRQWKVVERQICPTVARLFHVRANSFDR